MTITKRLKSAIKNLPELLESLTLKGKRVLLTNYTTRLSLINQAITIIEHSIKGDEMIALKKELNQERKKWKSLGDLKELV